MSMKIIYVVMALSGIIASYSLGYSHAKARGDANVEALKASHAQEIVTTQEIAKNEYEKQIAQLSADLADVRSANVERMRELEQFRSARGDLASCRRDRSRLAGLAVRGETLLKRADAYFATFESANSR